MPARWVAVSKTEELELVSPGTYATYSYIQLQIRVTRSKPDSSVLNSRFANRASKSNWQNRLGYKNTKASIGGSFERYVEPMRLEHFGIGVDHGVVRKLQPDLLQTPR